MSRLVSGGLLNYSATVRSGEDVLAIEVKMLGVDLTGKPNDMIVSINGYLPKTTSGARAMYNDFTADYRRVGTG